MFLFDTIIGGALKAGWSTTKNVGRGVVGSRNVVDEVGEKTLLSSRQRWIKGIKEKGNKVFGDLGKDATDSTWENFKTRVDSGLGVFHESTFGGLGLALGWGAKKTTQGVAKATPYAFKGAAKLTSQAMDVIGDTAINTAEGIYHLAKSPYGSAALFAAPLAFTSAKSAINTEFNQSTTSGLAIHLGQQLESLPGAVTPSNKRLDNLGADGDLVFALHNLR